MPNSIVPGDTLPQSDYRPSGLHCQQHLLRQIHLLDPSIDSRLSHGPAALPLERFQPLRSGPPFFGDVGPGFAWLASPPSY